MKSFVSVLLLAVIVVYSCCKQKSQINLAANEPLKDTTTTTNVTETNTEPAVVGQNLNTDGFYKQMHGKIGNSDVQMNLVKTGNKLYGSYSYAKVGELIDLTPPENSDNIDADGNFALAEFSQTKNEGYSQTGTFKGKILPDGTVSGAWSSPDAGKILNFSLSPKLLKDAAGLKMVNIEKQEGNCQTEEPCAHIEVIYPLVATVPGNNALAIKKINSTISKALSESMPTEEPTSPEQAVVQFIRDFKEQDAELKMSWEHEVMTNIYHNVNNVLSLGFSAYSFTGGAHPNHAESFYNFNLATGNEIELTDIFKSGYEKKITALAEQQLRKLYNIGTKTPLTEAGFFEDKFALNDNFSVSDKGITFLYNPYEIAPYAMGEQSVFIPFATVKDLLNPNGVITW